MRERERNSSLVHAPKPIWDVVLRGRYVFAYDKIPITITRMSGIKRLNLFRSAGNLLSIAQFANALGFLTERLYAASKSHSTFRG